MEQRSSAVDHLVVIARTLTEGVAWCEAALGVTPGPGGEHPLFGTHNRLLNVASDAFPGVYFEIIAINSVANYHANKPAKRWFDMDSPLLQASLAAHGPQLAHWVARVPDVHHTASDWRLLGLERGAPKAASRQTPHGLLQWQITVREDGQRLMDGCLPTLIEWGADPQQPGAAAQPIGQAIVHPTDHMPASGLHLQALHLRHPQAPLLSQALAAAGLPSPVDAPLQVMQGLPQLEAQLLPPKGVVRVRSVPLSTEESPHV